MSQLMKIIIRGKVPGGVREKAVKAPGGKGIVETASNASKKYAFPIDAIESQ